MDTLLRYNEMKNQKEEKKMIEYKKLNPSLHHWIRKFRAEVDTNGKKKLFAKKPIKKG